MLLSLLHRTNYIKTRSFQETVKCLSSTTPQAIHSPIAGRQRFYKEVGCVAADSTASQFQITLDGKTLKTPARNDLLLPSKALALCIAAEWDAQGSSKGIQPVTMPMMSLASTAIDHIAVDPTHTLETCLSFLPTDTTLFLTVEEQRSLHRKQKQHFAPLHRWAKKVLGVDFSLQEDNMLGRVQHPKETKDKIEKILIAMDPFTLAAVQCATMECKSIILALALIYRHASLEDAILCSRLEEEFQAENWGVVEGGHDMDRLNNRVNLSSVDVFIRLLHLQNSPTV